MVEPGTVLAGKFQVERVLGEGGMGVVVAAQHLQLGQRVALKFLLREALANPVVSERFLREARAAVKLRSEHVGRVIDVGTLDDGAPYIVMEYLDGCDLQQFLAQHGRLPVAQAVDFCLQACEAVAEAHAQGLIHRDLKPANLFLTVRPDGGGLIKVLDFGIAKATNETTDFSLTRTATVMGSPGYMSPEQLRSARDVDERTDIWALGVILYELVTGRAPFAAETITELTLKVAMDPVPAMGADVPAPFAEVVSKCLSKEVSERYGSIAELAAALVPFGPQGSLQQAQRIARVQAGGPTTMQRSAAMAVVATMPTTLSATAGAAAPVAPPRRKLGLVIGGVVLAAAAIIALVVVLSSRSKGEAARPAAAPPPAVSDPAPGSSQVVAPPPGPGASDPSAPRDPSAGSAVDPAAGSAVADPAAGSAVDPAAGSAVDPAAGSAVADPSAGSARPSGGSSRRHGRNGGSSTSDPGAGSSGEDFSNSRH